MSSCISSLSRAQTSSSHQRLTSEPHSYNIQAKLRNGILSIFVHDTQTNCQWRQEFTQISFPSHKLYHVAKALIMAIQTMINSAKNNEVANKNEPKPIAILVYNQWCYLTIQNSQFPSFALRPIQIPQNYANYATKPLPSSPSSNNDTKRTSLANSHQPKYTKPNLSHLPFPTRPLPPLPVAHKMSVKAAEQHSYSRSVKLGQSHPQQSHEQHQHNYAHSMYIPSAPTQKCVKKDMSKPHIIEDDEDDAFSSSTDYEDEMLNSEDEDSDSFKYGRMHSNDTSMDSMLENTGSLDSLFTNSGSNRDSGSNASLFSRQGTLKKMKIFNVSVDDDDEEEEESEEDEYESVSPMNGFRTNTRWISGGSDKQKRAKNGQKKQKNSVEERELVICLNGSVIDDLEHHAMEQIIAEEEYYEEEDNETPEYYDPNFLGVQPYYDD